MKFPSVLVSAIVVGVLAILQHLLLHVTDFHVSELYAPIIVAVLSAAIRAVQEWNAPQPTATARGLDAAEQDSYLMRVIAG